MNKRLLHITVFFCLLLCSLGARAQYKIKGTVYDSTRNYPLELVSVITSAGSGTVTNRDGEYEVSVGIKDSIWFSYLNKPTKKFAVATIVTPFAFDIALNVQVTTLKEVSIRPRNYKQDSLQNREDYARVFEWEKPGLSSVRPSYGGAAGFDLNELISVFQFRKNRSMRSFQQRLMAQEQEKYVEHRFNKGLVRRLTGLTEPAIDSFMIVFKPPYFFVMSADEYTFQKYIKDMGERFSKGYQPIDFSLFLNPEEEDQ